MPRMTFFFPGLHQKKCLKVKVRPDTTVGDVMQPREGK